MFDFIPFKWFQSTSASHPSPLPKLSEQASSSLQESGEKRVISFAKEYFDENDENDENASNLSNQSSTDPASSIDSLLQQVSQSPFHAPVNTPEKDLDLVAVPMEDLLAPKELYQEEIASNEVIEKISLLIQNNVCDHPLFHKFEGVQIACQELFGNLKCFNLENYGLIWCDDAPEDIFPISISDATVEKYVSQYPGYINPFSVSSLDPGLKQAALNYNSKDLKKAFTPNDYSRGGSYTLATHLKNLLLLTSGRNAAFCCFRYQGKRYTVFTTTASSYKAHSEIKVLACLPPDLLLKYHYKGFFFCGSCNSQEVSKENSQLSSDNDSQIQRTNSSTEHTAAGSKNKRKRSKPDGEDKAQPYSPFHPRKKHYKRAFSSVFQQNLSKISNSSSFSGGSDAILKLFTERQPCQKARGHVNCEDKLKLLIGFPQEPLEAVTTYFSCSYPKDKELREEASENYKKEQERHLKKPPQQLHKGDFRTRQLLAKVLKQGPAVDNTPGKLYANTKSVTNKCLKKRHAALWLTEISFDQCPDDFSRMSCETASSEASAESM